MERVEQRRAARRDRRAHDTVVINPPVRAIALLERHSAHRPSILQGSLQPTLTTLPLTLDQKQRRRVSAGAAGELERHSCKAGRGSGPALVLVNLEVTQVFGGGRVGRTLKESSKALDVANILMLGPGRQAAHHHVVLHPLAQRTDRGGSGSHGKFLSLKELHDQTAASPRPKPMIITLRQPHATLPRSGFVLVSGNCHANESNSLPFQASLTCRSEPISMPLPIVLITEGRIL